MDITSEQEHGDDRREGESWARWLIRTYLYEPFVPTGPRDTISSAVLLAVTLAAYLAHDSSHLGVRLGLALFLALFGTALLSDLSAYVGKGLRRAAAALRDRKARQA